MNTTAKLSIGAGLIALTAIVAAAMSGPDVPLPESGVPAASVPVSNSGIPAKAVPKSGTALPSESVAYSAPAPTNDAATPARTVAEPRTSPASQQCHPSYSGCLDPNVSDYDCAGGSGNGPRYTGRVQVTGPDVFDLDRDGDGWGCE